MSIRFSTEAANADTMGTDADVARTQPELPGGQDAARAAREPGKPLAGKPGKDINAAGFLKDKDRQDTDGR